ncbi:MAG: tRNA 5-methylaminomethyl-2-thiouridine synthase [Tardiphaga sp.]
MTRYHYDISGDHPFRDEDGMEQADDRAAWREATRLTRDIEDHLRPNGMWKLTVRTDTRLVYLIEVTALYSTGN